MKNIALLLLAPLLGACGEKEPRPEPLYPPGSFVKAKLSGERGQVIRTACYRGGTSCYYDVRFVARQELTNTTMWGSDGAVEVLPLATVGNMREFELEPAQ